MYHILYAPGSGGVFLSNIFLSYLGVVNALTTDGVTGQAHYKVADARVTLGHLFTDIISNASRKIVAITYDPDDHRHLQTMNFYKYFKPLINNPNNYNFVVEKWSEPYIKKMLALDDAEQKEMFIETALPGLSGDIWGINKNINKFDLVIPFKQMITNASALNRKISNFLGVTATCQVELYIQEWQTHANFYKL